MDRFRQYKVDYVIAHSTEISRYVDDQVSYHAARGFIPTLEELCRDIERDFDITGSGSYSKTVYAIAKHIQNKCSAVIDYDMFESVEKQKKLHINDLTESDSKGHVTLDVTDTYDDQIYADILVDGTVVGDLTVITDFYDEYTDVSDCCYVERIDILPEYQNNGIGTEVLTHTLFDTFDYKCRTVIVAPDNADAQRLYSRIGNEVSGDMSRVFGDFDQGYGVYEI